MKKIITYWQCTLCSSKYSTKSKALPSKETFEEKGHFCIKHLTKISKVIEYQENKRIEKIKKLGKALIYCNNEKLNKIEKIIYWDMNI